MISEKYKFIFVHANKTGGNSINDALSNYGEKYPAEQGYVHSSINFPHSQHWSLVEILKTGNFKDYFKFSISRNPWDRMVSYYRKNVCNPISPAYVDVEFNDWVKMAFVDRVTPEYEKRIDERYIHKENDVYRREHDGIRNIDEVFFYIKNENGKIGVDFVIDFSNISTGFKTVCKHLGIKATLKELTQMRSDVRTHSGRFFKIKSYHDMYDSESVDIIKENFSNDIKIFGYNYE
tara:strand:+ start:626 stop:1330 length:705 start_codon:yes stop_codon:yes gene_type:complete